ncbi:MAG: Plug domain-containing protein, partial [Lentisphaeraceae bacterium]|nr:Plug domain-containing protein [Lentisphaeraceae bacterium]
MKKLYITLALLLCITLHAQEFPNSSLKHDNYTFTLEELSQIIIVSATREPISYFDSPSPVTVFTEEQIERYSLQNLVDIIQRTPGFFTVPGTFELRVGNRGFVQKGQNYLLLLDGHNMNFASRADMGLQPLFPFNHDLKQV